MIDLLITYLPFVRAGDIAAYFSKNREILKPRRAIAYVDSDSSDWKREAVNRIVGEGIEIRMGEWNDRTLCLVDIFKDLREMEFERALIVDSDNVLDSDFQAIDGSMQREGYDFYTVMDHTSPSEFRKHFIGRSKLVGTVYNYRIAGTWHGIYFIGPKQGIVMSSGFVASLHQDILSAVSESMKGIPARARQFMTDETTLGIILYYSGTKLTPWVVGSHHYRVPPSEASVMTFTATAWASFGRALLNRFFTPRVLWFYLRYKAALIFRSLM